MMSTKHTQEIKDKADHLDMYGVHPEITLIKNDMKSAVEIMYQDRAGGVLPPHLRNEFPQQSGGIPTSFHKSFSEELKTDTISSSNVLHREISTKASKQHDFHCGPLYNAWDKGQVETTDKPISANAFHGTGHINDPTNPLVKDYFVESQHNTFQQPQKTANKPQDRSLIHSDEADRHAMGLGKGEFTDRPDPNQLQTSTHNLTSAEPLHNQAGHEMVKDRPLAAEETKESLGPYQKSMPVQREYMTMASKKNEEDMTLGQKIMDTAAHSWDATKNWFSGNKHEAEESGEKASDKAADTLESTKEKATEGVKTVKEKAAETKQNIVKEIGPEKEKQLKSTSETIKDKAEAGWEATKEKAEEGLEAAEEKAGDAKKWAGKKIEQGEEAIKDAGEKVKKTVTYVSETMHEKAEALWDKAHKRDDKLYVDEGSDKTQFQKVYEQQFENPEIPATEAKDLLEEPHERAVQLKDLSLHNPIERPDLAKNKEEVLQENAETAAELLAPRVKDEGLKTVHQKSEEKQGKHKPELGLKEGKPSMTGEKISPEKLSEKEKGLGEKVKEASLDPVEAAKTAHEKAVDWVNDKTGHEHFLL